MPSIDVDLLLQKWDEAKKQIADLEERITKYKKAADKLMEEDNTLVGKNFSLTKRTMTRETITKRDVPSEVWSKYAKRVSFPAYYLSFKGKKVEL